MMAEIPNEEFEWQSGKGKRPTCRNRRPRLCSPLIHTEGIALALVSVLWRLSI